MRGEPETAVTPSRKLDGSLETCGSWAITAVTVFGLTACPGGSLITTSLSGAGEKTAHSEASSLPRYTLFRFPDSGWNFHRPANSARLTGASNHNRHTSVPRVS